MDNNPLSLSKPLIAIGVLVGVLMVMAFIPAEWFGIHPISYKEKPLDLSLITSASEIAQDANGDGVISWKEVIAETFKDSTEADDIKDATVDAQAIEHLNDPNNLTGSFSKNLYLASAYINKNGGADTASQQAVLDQLISDEAQKMVPTTYTYKDLQVSKQEDKTSLKIYGNSVASIFQKIVTRKIMEDDFASINSFIQTKNESDLSILTKNKVRVDSLLQEVLSMHVPPSAISFHILALNRIAFYRDTLDNLSKAESDPVRAKIALEQYAEMIVLVLRIPAQFSQYFNLQNIVFSPQNPGYMFTAGYTISN